MLKKRNKRGGDREYRSVRQSSSLLSVLRRRSCSKPSFTSVIIKWGSLWFSAANSLRWHQAHTTAYRVNRSHFASVRHHSLLYFLEHKWIAKHVALTDCRLVRECEFTVSRLKVAIQTTDCAVPLCDIVQPVHCVLFTNNPAFTKCKRN